MSRMSTPADPSPEILRETIDHLAINRLQARYADAITRRAWAELGELFLPDMVLHLDTATSPARDLVGAAEIGGFIDAAVQRFAFFEFVILSSHVVLDEGGDPDSASARLWMCEVRCGHDSDDDQGEWTTAYGLYRDRYRRVDGRWWFAERSYRSLARTGEGGGVFPLPDLPD